MVTGFTACRGGAKAGKAVKEIFKHGDDAVRIYDKITEDDDNTYTPTYTTQTEECLMCDGYGMLDYYDDYGNYQYTDECYVCDGKGYIYQ